MQIKKVFLAPDPPYCTGMLAVSWDDYGTRADLVSGAISGIPSFDLEFQISSERFMVL